ncbi:MAG: MarR family winged helix-turn-helix transcriptional regulator [Microthrixaceae bacterium]
MNAAAAPASRAATAVPDAAAAGAPPQDVAPRLQMVVTRLARRMRREAGSEMTPSQLSVLASIHRHGPITLGDLAGCERVAPPTITKVVGKLEEDGLVQRITDAADRRVVRVITTTAGDHLVTSNRARKVAWLDERIEALPARDRARLAGAVQVLERLVDSP